MSEYLENTPVVEDTKETFLSFVEDARAENPRVSFYPDHVKEVERWAIQILRENPEADPETVLLGVWLHDIGNLFGDKTIDHAVRSEEYTKRLLSLEGLPDAKIEAVAHCVRAHRNSDVHPQTLEAKIVAAADSASHMSGDAYLPSAGMKRTIGSSLAKLERDYRDVGLVPGLQEKLTPLYNAWKVLLSVYPKFN